MAKTVIAPVSGAPFRWTVAAACLGLASFVAGSEPRPELYVATLNLAHGRGLASDQFRVPLGDFARNLEAVASVINRERPDVLALQEADGPSSWSGGFDHVQRLAGDTAYPYVYHGVHFQIDLVNVPIRYGTALLALGPLQSPASVRFRAPLFHTKGFVLAEIEFAGRPVVITSVHLDSGSREVRRKTVEDLVNALQNRGKPLILMGDLNSRWADEADAVRILASRLRLGAFQPENPNLATFPSMMPKRRIDWILISEELAFVEYGVWGDAVSDHRGVAARLCWRRDDSGPRPGG